MEQTLQVLPPGVSLVVEGTQISFPWEEAWGSPPKINFSEICTYVNKDTKIIHMETICFHTDSRSPSISDLTPCQHGSFRSHELLPSGDPHYRRILQYGKEIYMS